MAELKGPPAPGSVFKSYSGGTGVSSTISNPTTAAALDLDMSSPAEGPLEPVPA